MSLSKKIFLGAYWLVVSGVVFLLYQTGTFGGLYNALTAKIGDFAVGAMIALGVVGAFLFGALQDQIWNLLLYTQDFMAGTTGHDVGVRDKIREAKAFIRRNQWEQAGRVYEEIEELKDAAECYQKAGQWDMSARVLESLGDLINSAKMYEKAGSFEQAAQLLERAKDEVGKRSLHLRAGERALMENRLRPAADHFIQAKQMLRAAELLERLKHFHESGDIFLKEGYAEKAATLFLQAAQDIQDQLNSGNPPPGAISKMAEAKKRAVDALEASDQNEKAAVLAEEIGEFAKAGVLYNKLDQYEKAADNFAKGGKTAEARQALIMSGNTSRMAEFTALEALEAGDYDTASREFLRVGKLEQALDACRRGKNYDGMGRIYEKMGRYVTAGEQYSMARQFDKAAEMYEKGQDYRQAAELYERQGHYAKALAALEKCDDHFMAGKLNQRLKNRSRAIACYQKVPKTDPNYRLATVALAALLVDEEQFDQALNYINSALDAQPEADDELLDSYYRLADGMERNGQAGAAAQHFKRIMSLNYSFKDVTDRFKKVKDFLPGNATVNSDLSGPPNGNAGFASRTSSSHPRLSSSQANPVIGSGEMEGIPDSPPSATRRSAVPGWGGKPSPAALASVPRASDSAYQPTAILAPQTDSQRRFSSASQPLNDPEARYELIDEIGRGGMGVVYKARDTGLDRIVALKLLPVSLSTDDPHGYDAFLREARTIAKLQHPNIVTVYDIGVRQDRFYIATEFIGGGSLRHFLMDKGTPTIGTTIRVMTEIAQGLKHAHREGVVHRDIKPGNILLTEQAQIKIVDFGLAKIIGEAKGITGAALSEEKEMTSSGGFLLGTPQYMSPEQIKGERLDQRTDIYSYGLTFYYMLVGKHVFEQFGCKSPMEIVDHQLKTELPSPRKARPDLPPEVELVYYGCIEKNRDKRFTNMQQVLDQLSAVPV